MSTDSILDISVIDTNPLTIYTTWYDIKYHSVEDHLILVHFVSEVGTTASLFSVYS